MADVLDIRRAESVLLPGEKPLSEHPAFKAASAQ